MAYLKDELSGFIPEESSSDIIRKVTRGSSILRMSKVDEMKSDKKKLNSSFWNDIDFSGAMAECHRSAFLVRY